MGKSVDRLRVTGLILAGGQGARMGGVDKGLLDFRGRPLVQTVLERLMPQVDGVMISANRHVSAYQALGVAVLPDEQAGYAGPLAGFVTGLAHCHTPLMMTVPCDTPGFPLDMVTRLWRALVAAEADVAMPATCAVDAPGQWRSEPVFCLMKTTVLAGLQGYVASGQRKVEAWAARQNRVLVPFEEADAFVGANTPAQLQALAGWQG